MAVDHYENFPVASLLLPRKLRSAVRDIYRYARTADDIADEGDAPARERLAALAEYRRALDLIGGSADPALLPHPHIFLPLRATIERHGLPLAPLRDLLSAFEQDVVKHRYDDDTELLDYCRRSADPVGRLLLHLYERRDAANLVCADAICTGLQLTNFWQDVALDWHKGRVYLPRDKRERHGVQEAWLDRCARAGRLLADGSDAAAGAAWNALMREQVEQARRLLRSGLPLTRRLPWRAGLELRLVIQGGLLILERLEQLNYDVFERRPVLRSIDWPRMALRALFK
ncbi:squalene synthase HpnC [Alcaligenaceae bacterium]|nr:squalene synthase HpnC [Alcaligenaceae bacterium]